jgi:hypothetical protein
MPTIECVWFLLLYTSTHWWTILKRYVYEPLVYDHGFEGLSWKWTNNVLTIFHLKSGFFVFCLQMPQMQVGLSWCSQDFLVGAQVGAQRLIPCLVTISWGTRKFQGTNVLVTEEIYTNVHDFVQEVSLKLSPNMTNLRSASGGGQMCLIWQKKRYQCPRSAHKSFSMRSVFHLW